MKRFVIFIVLIPIIIVPLTSFIVYTKKMDVFVDLFLMFIPLILTIIIWQKTPRYLDHFHVREECIMLIIISLILMIFYLIFDFITKFLVHAHDIFIIVLCIEYIYLFGIFIAGLHLTYWTLIKNKHRLTVNQQTSSLYLKYRTLNRVISTTKKINVTQTIHRKLSAHQNETDPRQNETVLLLISILEHEHGFQMFLSHLLTEFCLESALAIIEFTQYQILMKESYADHPNHTISNDVQLLRISVEKQSNILKLPDIVPKSVIVHNPEQEDGVFNIKNIAKCYYKNIL